MEENQPGSFGHPAIAESRFRLYFDQKLTLVVYVLTCVRIVKYIHRGISWATWPVRFSLERV